MDDMVMDIIAWLVDWGIRGLGDLVIYGFEDSGIWDCGIKNHNWPIFLLPWFIISCLLIWYYLGIGELGHLESSILGIGEVGDCDIWGLGHWLIKGFWIRIFGSFWVHVQPYMLWKINSYLTQGFFLPEGQKKPWSRATALWRSLK